MKISELPEDIRIIAELRRKSERSKKFIKSSDFIMDCFNWSKTPEGGMIWDEVHRGNLQPIRDFHAKETKIKLPLEIPIDGKI